MQEASAPTRVSGLGSTSQGFWGSSSSGFKLSGGLHSCPTIIAVGEIPLDNEDSWFCSSKWQFIQTYGSQKVSGWIATLASRWFGCFVFLALMRGLRKDSSLAVSDRIHCLNGVWGKLSVCLSLSLSVSLSLSTYLCIYIHITYDHIYI